MGYCMQYNFLFLSFFVVNWLPQGGRRPPPRPSRILKGEFSGEGGGPKIVL